MCYLICLLKVLIADHSINMSQVVVEKKLMQERKLTRHDLGREGFVSEVGYCFLMNVFFSSYPLKHFLYVFVIS